MTRTRRTEAPEPEIPEADPLAGLKLPPVPAEFSVSGFDNPNDAWQAGLREVDADKADRSGPDKGYRAVRRLSWGVGVLGGSGRQWQERLGASHRSRAAAEARLHRLEAHASAAGWLAEATGEIEAADQNIAHLTALIQAAEKWEGTDNLTLRHRLDAAQMALDTASARMEPYRRARLPVDPAWEDNLYQAEKARSTAEAAFAEGRRKLDSLSAALRDARAQAYRALVGSLGHVAHRIGQAVDRCIKESGDPDFLLSFPGRAPDEVLTYYARAERVSAIMCQLGAAAPDAGLTYFWQGCQEVEEIVRGKVGADQSFRRESGMRPPRRSPDAIMNEQF